MNIDDEYVKKMSHDRRIRQQALAVLRRGKEAGIPERFLRTSKKQFQSMLCDKYHDSVDDIANLVFDTSNRLLKFSYILIDGGDSIVRTQVGYTILFRMIACDKNGLYERCSAVSHKMEDMKSDGTMSRNEYVDLIKGVDALFMGEIKADDFNVHLGASSYMDELLGYRFDKGLPTIFSFTNPLCSKNEINIKASGEVISALSIREFASQDKKTNPTDSCLRVRVKSA